MRRHGGLILVVFTLVVLLLGVAAIADFLASSPNPARGSSGSPAPLTPSSPGASGNVGAGGEETGSHRPPARRPTDTTTHSPSSAGADAGSSGSGTRWPNVFNSWTGGGDRTPDCESSWGDTPRSPYIGDGSAGLTRITLGEDRQICLAGFDIHREISLTIDRPDGTRHTATAVRGEEAAVGPTDLLAGASDDVLVFAGHGDYLATGYEQLEPDMPLGAYILRAEQGELNAEATVELQRGPLGDPHRSRLKPQDTYEYAHSVRVGDQLTVLLLHFPPDSAVPLAVYRNTGVFRRFGTEGASEHGDGFDFQYVLELSTVTVNNQGWAYYTMTVPDSLPAAVGGGSSDYCVVTVPDLMVPDCQPATTFTFAFAS